MKTAESFGGGGGSPQRLMRSTGNLQRAGERARVGNDVARGMMEGKAGPGGSCGKAFGAGGVARTLRLLGFVAGLLAGFGVSAVTLVPVEFRQTSTPYNLQSQRGVPISSVTNLAVGSDGRLPTGINESGTGKIGRAHV